MHSRQNGQTPFATHGNERALITHPSPSSRTTYLPIPLAPPHCCPFTSVCRYATYCNNFPVAQQLLEGCRHNDQTANFVLFEQQCAQTKECAGLDLGSFLIKPVQRICKYVFH